MALLLLQSRAPFHSAASTSALAALRARRGLGLESSVEDWAPAFAGVTGVT